MKRLLFGFTLLVSMTTFAGDFDTLVHDSKITNKFTNIAIRGLPVVFGTFEEAVELAESRDKASELRKSVLDTGALKIDILNKFCKEMDYEKVEDIERRILRLDEDRAVYKLVDQKGIKAVYQMHRKTHESNLIGSDAKSDGALLQLKSITCSKTKAMFEIL